MCRPGNMQISLGRAVRCNPNNAVGGSFILSLQRTNPHSCPVIPPTQLVDSSYSAYKSGHEGIVFSNPTNAVGGSFILGLQRTNPHSRPVIPPTQLVDRSYSAYKGRRAVLSGNPTNEVGGSFILSIIHPQFDHYSPQSLRKAFNNAVVNSPHVPTYADGSQS
jgi:hypothetical protein